MSVIDIQLRERIGRVERVLIAMGKQIDGIDAAVEELQDEVFGPGGDTETAADDDDGHPPADDDTAADADDGAEGDP